MGIFDFLFGNKKKEREHQEQLRLQQEAEANRRTEEQRMQEEVKQHAEGKRKQDEANNKKKFASAVEIKKPNTSVLPTNEAVSERLEYLASQANWSFNTGNQQATVKFMNELFDACYGRNGYKLLQISEESTQIVGLAFTIIARYLDFNDQDLNSVAAENALYCLARNLIVKGNSFCAPAIFTLLLNHSDLLKDKLISTHCEIAQQDVGMPIGIMLGGNPFNAPHLNGFREQAVSKRVPIMAYILPFFYNEDINEYSIPTDMPYHIPSQSEIKRFIRMKSQYGGTNDSMLLEGKRYFYQIFEECQDTLLKTKSM